MKIEVFHDTVCPWCRIGKRHLQLVLETWPGQPVTVQYRSFFLNPDIPADGYDFAPYMLAKGGGRMSLEDFFAGPRRMGEAVGLTFNFENIQKAPNSLLSHRLIALTPPASQPAILEAVYAAYFEHGQDIGRLEVLVGLAAEIGLDHDRIGAQLSTDEGLAQVMQDITFARQVGISGVPFFIFNNKYAFSGAQPPESIRSVMQQVAQEGDE
jgi:predicted DsbA family dithiol-disulfide isomerase